MSIYSNSVTPEARIRGRKEYLIDYCVTFESRIKTSLLTKCSELQRSGGIELPERVIVDKRMNGE
jgi:hypothetical protein